VTARQPSARPKDRLEGRLLSLLFIRDSHPVYLWKVESQRSKVKSKG
jgi:hypothetical protein